MDELWCNRPADRETGIYMSPAKDWEDDRGAGYIRRNSPRLVTINESHRLVWSNTR